MPIMLGSTHCHLYKKKESEITKMNECIYDPKGYFILKGTEKVVLIHEQMAKNRIFVEFDSKTKSLFSSVQSKNFETISKTKIITKDGKLYVKANSFTEPIPIFIMFKAMKLESDYVIRVILGHNADDRHRKVYDGIFESMFIGSVTLWRQNQL